MSVPDDVKKKHPYHRPDFIVKKKGEHVKQIKASYNSASEWQQDPQGYFIVKVFYDGGYFGARFHTNDGEPKVDILGTDAEEIVQTIVREKLVSSIQHAAYLGHELHKAEMALRFQLNFVQDTELDFSKKTKKRVSDNLPE